MEQSAQVSVDKKLTAVYAPFKSFLSSLDHLKEGLPDELDPSAWPTMSGGLKGQILAGYKFLGLIDENARVQPVLAKLVGESTRKDTLKAIIHKAYANAYAIDLARATPNQLADALRSNYGVDGSTLEKAQTFFLHAARFVGDKLSPSIQRKTRTAPRRRRNNAQSAQPSESLEEESPAPETAKAKAHGGSKTIKLKGGGSATLSFDVDVFDMSDEDQTFVFDQIRRMKEYEGSAGTETPASAGTAERA